MDVGNESAMSKRTILLLLVLILAVALLPALASDGCGWFKLVSAGCGASGMLTAMCLPLIVLAIRRTLRPAGTARPMTLAHARAAAPQRAPPGTRTSPPTPAPLRL
jgi:hypothetical protein